MFPTDIDFENLEAGDEENQGGGDSFRFDYLSGEFILVDGKNKKIDGIEAVKQWVELMLRTKPGAYIVYGGSSFGVDTKQLMSLKNLPSGFVQSELKREIQEGLTLNPYIDFADQFEFTRVGKTMVISFIVHLKNGEETGVSYHV